MNKKLLFGSAIGVFLLASVLAGVYLFSIDTNATVGEPLSTTTVSLDMSGYAGETIVQYVNITNLASVPEKVKISWTETSNLNGVNYTTDMEKVVELSSGDNAVPLTFIYAGDSVTGDVEGDVVLERIA